MLDYLRLNNELSLFIKSLDYSNSSIFNIIFCDDMVLIDTTLQYILYELEKESNPKVLVNLFETKENDIDILTQQLDKFLHHKTIKSDNILIIDLSFLAKTKIYESELIFSKLNRLRNSLMNYNVPIILILPTSMQKTFITNAPDFWSIKSKDIFLEYYVEDDNNILNIDINKNNSIEEKSIDDEKLSQLLNNHIKLKSQKDRDTNELLMYVCTEIGDFYLNYKTKNFEEIQKYYNKALKIAQNRLKEQPNSIVAKQHNLVNLDRLADIYRRFDRLTDALKYAKTYLKLAKEIYNIDPKSINAKRDLSIAFEKVADVWIIKDRDKYSSDIYDYYHQSLLLREEIIKDRPNSIETKREFNTSMIKVADALKINQKIPEAINYYTKSLEIQQSILQIDSNNFEYKRDLCVILYKLADAYVGLNSILEARNYFYQSLQISKELVGLRPDSISSKNDLTIILIKLASIEDKKEAKKYLNEAKKIAQNNILHLDFKELLIEIDKINKWIDT